MKRSFTRTFDALPDVFAATTTFFDDQALAEDHRFAVDFAVEEIFTNMVKYQPGSTAPIDLELRREGNRIVVILTDHDVEEFDVTAAPTPDVDLPLERRKPGGLGLLLTRKVMTTVDYEYDAGTSRVIMSRELG